MRDNDFRYVFIGIETPEAHILDKTQKQLADDVSLARAVEVVSSYGMIVNAGFIMGFDNEDEHTAGNIIRCIEETGICMAMVGTLYALPNTQLTKRLKKEGRLISDGASHVDADRDVDQTSSGLNFVPTRPRADILRDYAKVLKHIYSARNYYARVKRTGVNLRSYAKHRPSFLTKLRLGWSFLKMSSWVSVTPRVAFLYWKTFFRFLFSSPGALVATVNLSAMYIHFYKQSRFIIKGIDKRMTDFEAAAAS
jgi:radical SAM superfamily enzyme YgiQ (UPF0313 family)